MKQIARALGLALAGSLFVTVTSLEAQGFQAKTQAPVNFQFRQHHVCLRVRLICYDRAQIISE